MAPGQGAPEETSGHLTRQQRRGFGFISPITASCKRLNSSAEERAPSAEMLALFVEGTRINSGLQTWSEASLG